MGAVRKLWLWFSWRRPVTWSLRHSVAGTQRRKQTTLNTKTCLTRKTLPGTNWRVFWQSITLLSFIFENAWEGHWFSEWLDWRPFTSEAKIEVIDGADVVLCAGAAAQGHTRGLNFFVWNFAWDRLASRLYAATATTFLMKTFRSMLIGPPIPGIQLFQNLKLEIQGQGQSWKSQHGSNIQSTHNLFFHVNRASHSWVTTFSKFDLEHQGSGSWVRS